MQNIFLDFGITSLQEEQDRIKKQIEKSRDKVEKDLEDRKKLDVMFFTLCVIYANAFNRLINLLPVQLIP